MQRNNIVESLIAVIVIAVAVGFLIFTLARTGTGSLSSYEISARMPRVDGLHPGSDVEIAGVKVGTVRSLNLEKKRYFVILRLAIRDGIAIPANSRLSVSGSVLGGSALLITPGNSSAKIPPGGILP